jgi:hypothetical protein
VAFQHVGTRRIIEVECHSVADIGPDVDTIDVNADGRIQVERGIQRVLAGSPALLVFEAVLMTH